MSDRETTPEGVDKAALPVRSRRRGAVIGSIAVVIAIVSGLLAVQLTRSTVQAEALTLSFAPGESVTYAIHMTMDGQIEEPTLGSQPLSMDITETLTWRVVSVDTLGVATVDVSASDVSGSVNGVSAPQSATDVPPVQLKIAPDGRILEAGGISLPASGQSSGSSFPGMGQYTPLLPDHPVKPGDSWTKRFSQRIPFGQGKIEYTANSTFDRYETVGGTKAAVVTTTFELPLNFTLDIGKLLKTFSGLAGSGSQGGPDLSSASVEYGGNGSFSMTAWVDPVAKQMLKSSSTGDFDMTMVFAGVPNAPGTINFKGSFAQELERK